MRYYSNLFEVTIISAAIDLSLLAYLILSKLAMTKTRQKAEEAGSVWGKIPPKGKAFMNKFTKNYLWQKPV